MSVVLSVQSEGGDMESEVDQPQANSSDHQSELATTSSRKVKLASTVKPYLMTPSEIESLRQEAKRSAAIAREAFRQK